MKELTYIRQIDGDLKRRWFTSEDMDLIIWLNNDQSFAGFELCYNKRHKEHSLTFKAGRGYNHMKVDDGEQRPGRHKGTPVLVANGSFDVKNIYSLFANESRNLPAEVVNYVLQHIERHPDYSL